MTDQTESQRLKDATREAADAAAAAAEAEDAAWAGRILTDKEILSAVITAVMSGEQAKRDEAVRKLQRHILRVEEERDQREAECERWATWGTIEVAIRNPNVASYIEHWEKRALSAEAERDALARQLEEARAVDAAWDEAWAAAWEAARAAARKAEGEK